MQILVVALFVAGVFLDQWYGVIRYDLRRPRDARGPKSVQRLYTFHQGRAREGEPAAETTKSTLWIHTICGCSIIEQHNSIEASIKSQQSQQPTNRP